MTGKYLGELTTPLLDAEQEVELAQAIEAGLYAEQLLLELAETGTEGLPEDELALVDELELLMYAGREAKDLFITANLRLVVDIAMRYDKNPNVQFLDLIGDGNLGLIRAVEKFDYTLGFKFSTYATPCIKDFIRRGIAHTGFAIRMDERDIPRLSKLWQFENEFRTEHDYEPTEEQAASFLGVGPMDIRWLRNRPRIVTSTDKPVAHIGDHGGRVGNQRNELVDVLAGTNTRSEHEDRKTTQQAEKLLGSLPDSAREVVCLHLGWYGGDGLSFGQIDRKLGLPRGSARVTFDESISMLREPVPAVVDDIRLAS